MRFALLACWLGIGAVALLGLALERALRSGYVVLPLALRVESAPGRGTRFSIDLPLWPVIASSS